MFNMSADELLKRDSDERSDDNETPEGIDVDDLLDSSSDEDNDRNLETEDAVEDNNVVKSSRDR